MFKIKMKNENKRRKRKSTHPKSRIVLSVKPSTKDNKYYIYSESNSLVD